MIPEPKQIRLAAWAARYEELRAAGLREPAYGGPLARHEKDMALSYFFAVRQQDKVNSGCARRGEVKNLRDPDQNSVDFGGQPREPWMKGKSPRNLGLRGRGHCGKMKPSFHFQEVRG